MRPVQARFHCGSGRTRPMPRRRRQLVGSLCKRHAVTDRSAPTACKHMVSGTVSLPCPGCFSPFPHGTRPLSVSREYLALPDGPGRFAQDFSCPALLRIPLRRGRLRIRGSHPLRPDFPDGSARLPFFRCRGPTTPTGRCHPGGLGSSPVARHYWGNHSLIFSSCRY